MTIRSEIEELRNEIVKIAEANGVSSIRLFGSVARKTDNKSSDIDFLVEFNEGRSLFDLIRLKQELALLFGRPVDVVTSEAIHPAIKGQIINEAIQL